MTQARTNIALRAVNPSFSLNANADVNYTLPLDEFQQTLIQQTAARKATREAFASRRQRGTRRNVSSDNQFFRSGPSSQQGGFFNNNATFNPVDTNGSFQPPVHNNGINNPTTSNNNFRFNNHSSRGNNKSSNNPFRQ